MLRRYMAYLEKIFGFERQVAGLRDRRDGAHVATRSVWMSVFLMFALRLRSFHRLELELHRPGQWRRYLKGPPPSADTLGYCLSRFHLEELREMLQHHVRTAGRNKAFQPRVKDGLRAIAFDGHELFWSTARCCEKCQVREVTIKSPEPHTEKQYYHRVVVAQIVGAIPPAILDVELIGPTEGETVAARRLWTRVVESYARLFDVVTADAIYLEAPFLKAVVASQKRFVVVMKQEDRELYQDADQLRRALAPSEHVEPGRVATIWDLSDLTTFTTLALPVRVVWCQERTTRNKVVGGETGVVTEDKLWVWVTNLTSTQANPTAVQRIGHDRWDVENRGFNELVHHWAMDHCFVHDTTAIEALLLTLALAFLTTYLFFDRNLKPEARHQLTRLMFGDLLATDVRVALQPSG